MIYDCFLFNDEFTLLDLRMRELSGVVDRFVICESNVSMRGKLKPMHFWERRHDFDMSKIVHAGFTTEPYPDAREGNCAFEHKMRSHLDIVMDGILKEDVVVFGDADEIPRPEFVAGYNPDRGAVRMGTPFSYYYFNLRVCDHEGHKLNHFRPIIAPSRMFKQHGFDTMRWRFDVGSNTADNAGWHFSYLGGYDALLRKIASHAEGACSDWVLQEPREVIEQRIVEGKLWNGSQQYQFVPVDETFPRTIRENYDKYLGMGLIKPV